LRGISKLICPNCIEGNKRSPKNGRYKIYIFGGYYVLKCSKCGYIRKIRIYTELSRKIIKEIDKMETKEITKIKVKERLIKFFESEKK
jgi:Zn-finger protein